MALASRLGAAICARAGFSARPCAPTVVRAFGSPRRVRRDRPRTRAAAARAGRRRHRRRAVLRLARRLRDERRDRQIRLCDGRCRPAMDWSCSRRWIAANASPSRRPTCIAQPGPVQLLAGAYLRISRDFLGGQRPPTAHPHLVRCAAGLRPRIVVDLVVALVTALAEHFSLALGEYEIAHLAYEIERIDLGSGRRQAGPVRRCVRRLQFHGVPRRRPGHRQSVADQGLGVGGAGSHRLLLYFTGVSRESARIIDEQSRNAASGASEPDRGDAPAQARGHADEGTPAARRPARVCAHRCSRAGRRRSAWPAASAIR